MNGIARLGWTLIHFVWQGAAIAAAYTIVRAWMLPRTTGPRGRYALACIALVLMAAAPVITYWIEGTGAEGEANAAASHALTSITPVTAGLPAHAVSGSSRGVSVASTSQAMPWIVAIWFAGALLCWIRLLGGCLVATRMRSTLVHPAPPDWRARLAKLCVHVEVSRPAKLLISAWVRVPIVVGWLRPVVLIPVGVLTGLSTEQMEAVLLHELAHIRRHDYLVNILQSIAEAFLFYHPAVWWISGHIRTERELCCDDAAVSLAGDAVSYARALAQLASLQRATVGAAMAVSGSSLTERIGRLLGQPEASSRALPIAAVFTIALIVSAAYGIAQSPAVPQWQTAAGGKMAFEVASVKLNNSGQFKPPLFGLGADDSYTNTGGRLTGDFSVATYIGFAYKLWLTPEEEGAMLSHFPHWVSIDRYYIEAQAPGNPTRDQMRLMMQSLMEGQFKLAVHFEARRGKIFALTLAKPGKTGPDLRPLEEGSVCDAAIPPPPVSALIILHINTPFPPGCRSLAMITRNGMRLVGARDITMDVLANALSMVGSLGRPVVDRSGLSARRWLPRHQMRMLRPIRRGRLFWKLCAISWD